MRQLGSRLRLPLPAPAEQTKCVMLVLLIIAKLPDALTCINPSLAKICTVRPGVPGLSPAQRDPGHAGRRSKPNLRPRLSLQLCYPVGEVGMLRKMFEHYRMLRFLRCGRWRSAKATIKTFCN